MVTEVVSVHVILNKINSELFFTSLTLINDYQGQGNYIYLICQCRSNENAKELFHDSLFAPLLIQIHFFIHSLVSGTNNGRYFIPFSASVSNYGKGAVIK